MCMWGKNREEKKSQLHWVASIKSTWKYVHRFYGRKRGRKISELFYGSIFIQFPATIKLNLLCTLMRRKQHPLYIVDKYSEINQTELLALLNCPRNYKLIMGPHLYMLVSKSNYCKKIFVYHVLCGNKCSMFQKELGAIIIITESNRLQ